ncbi:MAG: hypothetical protein JWM98_2007 [Thermoleophilia bacterium]|nr:hypothetical protein [Thermoleophilia bacterium]
MEHPSNREIAQALEELSLHSRFLGAHHPARAYRNAAASIVRVPVSVGALAMAGTATELRGIGASIQSRIVELCETGTIRRLEQLRQEAPPVRLLLTRLPGVGPKTAAAIWETLRPRTADDLMEMVDDGRLAAVRGVGPVTVDAVRLALHQLEEAPEELGEPLLRSHARRTVRDIETVLRTSIDGVLRVHDAGELARGCELVDVVDVVVVARDAEAAAAGVRDVLDHRGWRGVDEVATAGDRATTFGLDALSGAGLRIHVTDEAHAAVTCLSAIGPAEHAATVLELAGDAAQPSPASAAALYERAGLAWIAPELRDRPEAIDDARDAFARGERLPHLVRVEDLRGELHCHSTWSDGRADIATMARAAIERGLGHLAVTDHSWSLRIVNGLGPGDLAAQWREIEVVRAQLPEDFTLLQGIELEILPDGSLDFDADTLGRLDWVVASIHSRQRQDRDEITARMEQAMRSPFVDCIGHPTSRLLLRRAKTQLDTERLIELAAATGTCLEINSSADRLDLDSPTARRAAEAGVLLCINSDAHGADTLGIVEHGVAVARRAGLGPEQVINTRSWEEMRALQKRWRA